MIRYFLVLAVTAGSLLVASFVLGLMASGEPRGPHETNLRLLSSATDISGMPREGKNLIVVAAVRDHLHVRIFESDGKMVVDADEKSLTDKVPQFEELRKQLEGLWPPHEVTGNEKDRLIATVTSIVGPTRPHAVWHDIHILFALMTTLAALAVHSIVYTYFLATGKWAKEVVRVYQLPEWINTQAKKNKRKAFRFVMWSTTWICITAWFGAAADTQGTNPLWHMGIAAVMLAFNFGAFAVEYAVIVAQVRLLTEVKDQADHLREARAAEVAAAAGPT